MVWSVANPKAGASARAIAALVQPGDGMFDAHHAFRSPRCDSRAERANRFRSPDARFFHGT